ncbi:hypothetical protein MNBD_UNCLBAC01-681 [hydrothermal vent metagenome]|uniref:Uncharacterized protein n=1 Tax=hydrothermal vent metagenome TaxID=652676 RepID=A0A3B1DJ08_9ZZZZ
MRTTLNISDVLMVDLMKLVDVSSKTKAIELAIKEFIRKLKREKLKKACGQLDLNVDIMKLREKES